MSISEEGATMYTHEEINEMQERLFHAVEAIERAHSALKYWEEGKDATYARDILENCLNWIHGRKKEGEGK